jgi:hypothetical protein
MQKGEDMVERCSVALIGAVYVERGVGLSAKQAKEIIRAVLAAMREPTEAMVEAGSELFIGTDAMPYIETSVWHAMIDAALSNDEKERG